MGGLRGGLLSPGPEANEALSHFIPGPARRQHRARGAPDDRDGLEGSCVDADDADHVAPPTNQVQIEPACFESTGVQGGHGAIGRNTRR